ncbi:hypothetical protein ABPG72_002556 [Tetrahymena utriculariae]
MGTKYNYLASNSVNRLNISVIIIKKESFTFFNCNIFYSGTMLISNKWIYLLIYLQSQKSRFLFSSFNIQDSNIFSEIVKIQLVSTVRYAKALFEPKLNLRAIFNQKESFSKVELIYQFFSKTLLGIS